MYLGLQISEWYQMPNNFMYFGPVCSKRHIVTLDGKYAFPNHRNRNDLGTDSQHPMKLTVSGAGGGAAVIYYTVHYFEVVEHIKLR